MWLTIAISSLALDLQRTMFLTASRTKWMEESDRKQRKQLKRKRVINWILFFFVHLFQFDLFLLRIGCIFMIPVAKPKSFLLVFKILFTYYLTAFRIQIRFHFMCVPNRNKFVFMISYAKWIRFLLAVGIIVLFSIRFRRNACKPFLR